MRRCGGLAAVLAVRVAVVHVGCHGPGPVQRHQRADVLELGGRHGAQQRAHRRGLQLEHAHRVARLQQAEGGVVVERHFVDVERGACAGLQEPHALVDDRQRAQPQEVHLQQAEVFHAAHVELRDDGRLVGVFARLGLALDGQVVGQRLRADDHGRGMHRVLTDQPLEPPGHVHHLTHVVVAGVHVAQLGGGGVPVCVPLDPLEAGSQRRVAPHDERRHRLGHPVAQRVRLAQHPACVAHRRPGLDRGERDDLRHMVVAVLVGCVADHVVAVAVVEVDVDVGHRDAGGVQEPLEQQPVVDRVEIGDAQAVRNGAPRRRAAPGPHPDAGLTGMADEVPRDEEVAAEAHVGDDPQLIGDARRSVFGHVGAPAPLGPLERQVGEVGVGVGVGGGHLEVRQQRAAELDAHVGPLGDGQRVVAGLGVLAEQRPHFRGRLEIVLVAVELEPVGVAAQ